MKDLFIINPSAGRQDCSASLTDTIRREFPNAEICISSARGDCMRRTSEAGQSGEEYRVFACGGDGTLNEVVRGAVGFPNLSITCVPRGSGNDFIKQFSHPELFSDLSLFRETEERSIDLIRANDSWAINVCSVGFDARIGTDIDAFRRHPLLSGQRAYHASVIVNLIRGVVRPCRVELPGGSVFEGAMTLACVCNGGWYGGSYNPVPEADLCDGILDVLLVGKISRLTVAKVISVYQRGGYKEHPELIQHHQVTELRIITPTPQPVNLDGELIFSDDLHIQLVPKALRFFTPKGAW